MRSAPLGTGLLTLGLLAMSPRREPPASPLPRPPSVDASSGAPRQSTARIEGLLANADVEFDEYAVPTIRAASFLDALRLQGYLHARDRFAQMDLMRRFAAGELAEIASSLALTIDRDQRKMRLRAAALSALARLADDEREALEAYTAGVNAGLRSLEAPPPEYGFLKAPLEPWRLEYSLLVGLSMAAMLNDSAREEVDRAEIDESLSPGLVAFLRPAISRWDAPLLEDSVDDRTAAAVSIPSPSSIDTRVLRDAPPSPATEPSPRSPNDRSSANARPLFSLARAGASLEDELVGAPLPIGSNGWVVGPSRTKNGRAILVNDMHLQITVPGIWYRMSMAYDEASTTTTGRDSGAGAEAAPPPSPSPRRRDAPRSTGGW
jgi:penicillin amidase